MSDQKTEHSALEQTRTLLFNQFIRVHLGRDLYLSTSNFNREDEVHSGKFDGEIPTDCGIVQLSDRRSCSSAESTLSTVLSMRSGVVAVMRINLNISFISDLAHTLRCTITTGNVSTMYNSTGNRGVVPTLTSFSSLLGEVS